MGGLPPLRPIKRRRVRIDGFAGLNHNPVINERELYDMRNLQSALLPVLSPRKKRARVRALEKPNGLFAHDRLCWADGTAFYYDGVVKGQVADSEKRFARMGAYVLIWPDKCYYDTQADEFGSLEAAWSSTGAVSATLCRADGVAYDYTAGPEAPENPADGQYWVDTSDVNPALRLYSAATGLWGGIATVYTKISATGIGGAFSANDGVTVEGMADDRLNGSFYLVDAADDAIVIVAIIDANVEQTAPVMVKRSVPDLDFLTVMNNRVWGCSSANHEIYACKLGDPKNWNSYVGTSMDSYAVTVGSGGDFTGCCAHLGQVLFFKEDRILKLFGTRPSNFQLDDNPVRGVASGSEKSLAAVNEMLIYKSAMDVCAYGQALPTGISSQLGQEAYRTSVAGALGHLYYVSMEDDMGGAALFVYDTKNGVWMREDDTRALWFAGWNGDLYYIDGKDHCLYSVNGNEEPYGDDDAALEGEFIWCAQTGDIGLNIPDGKYISGIQLFVRAEPNTHLRVQAQYDEEKDWKDIRNVDEALIPFTGSLIGRDNLPTKRAFTLALHTPRCNTLRLRLSGTGEVWIYSMTLTVEQGSDNDGI